MTVVSNDFSGVRALTITAFPHPVMALWTYRDESQASSLVPSPSLSPVLSPGPSCQETPAGSLTDDPCFQYLQDPEGFLDNGTHNLTLAAYAAQEPPLKSGSAPPSMACEQILPALYAKLCESFADSSLFPGTFIQKRTPEALTLGSLTAGSLTTGLLISGSLTLASLTGAGPFTAMRSGLAFAQGLAMGLGTTPVYARDIFQLFPLTYRPRVAVHTGIPKWITWQGGVLETLVQDLPPSFHKVSQVTYTVSTTLALHRLLALGALGLVDFNA